MIGNIIRTDIEEEHVMAEQVTDTEGEQAVAEQAIPRQPDGSGAVRSSSWLSAEPNVFGITLSVRVTGCHKRDRTQHLHWSLWAEGNPQLLAHRHAAVRMTGFNLEASAVRCFPGMSPPFCHACQVGSVGASGDNPSRNAPPCVDFLCGVHRWKTPAKCQAPQRLTGTTT